MSFRDLGRVSLITFILLSLVSLFADMTYEGARSVSGAYLEVLSATAVFASLASIGEFLGYVMRFVSGVVAGYLKSSKGYWGLTFIGYILNLVAVPLLAFSGQWQIAVLLIFLERMGKGLRTPARDVILAEVTEKIGRGKAFGLHEALDQAGAVLGPLIVSAVLFISNNYALAFLILALPALASILFLSGAYIKYPSIKAAENATSLSKSRVSLNSVFWLYTISMSMAALGFMHWINVSYIFKAENIMLDYLISTMYLIAMLVDGLLAFPVGLIYDKIGLVSLLLTPIFATLVVPMILMNSFVSALFASIFWGIVMGIYESTARAAIADILPSEGRAYGYGIFSAFYGVAWMSGTIIYGYLYQNLTNYLLLFTIFTESAALIILLITVKQFKDFRNKDVQINKHIPS